MVLPLVEEIRALPTSLPTRTSAISEGAGRWRFVSRSSECNLPDHYMELKERSLSDAIEISKLKGQVFETVPNGKLMAANQRSMVYVMKDGFLRVINQSGADHFKLAKSSRARIIDIALTRDASEAKDSREDSSNVLLCLDEAGGITIFFVEACRANKTGRLQQIELVLSGLRPRRVVMHPKDSTCFVTLHSTSLRLWSTARLRAQTHVVSQEGTFSRVSSDPEDAFCCDTVDLPKVTPHRSADGQIRDLSFTADGSCIAAITEDCLFVWQRSHGPGTHQGLKLIQQMTIDKATSQDIWPEGPASIRFLALRERNVDVEALVLAAANGCSLAVYTFTRGSTQPVGPLLQYIGFAPEGSDAKAVVEVDSIMHATLALTFCNRNCFAVLPLASNFSSSSSRMAFPYVQRFHHEVAADHLALMTALSNKNVRTLFVYRIVLTRKEEASHASKHEVLVHQPTSAHLVSPEEAPELPTTPSSSSDKGPPEETEEVDEPPPAEAWANGIQSGADAEDKGGDGGDGSGDGLPADSAGTFAKKPEEVDMFVKRIAASFVLGLSKKKEHLADKIVQEVVGILKSNGSAGQSDAAMMDQVLAKVREAREVQSDSDKKLQDAVREATDAWAETSAASMSSLLSKEFGKLSQGVASNLAQQLSQSRKFCETLARGVQKSGVAATKQALESLRPPKQLQEAVGAALGEALQESLAPVFKAEIQSHFENELGPLIGHRVSEMLTAFRDSMTDCLEAIATEHEQVAERLGRDLAPLIADELKQVRHLVQSSSGGSGAMQEAQLDELMRAVETEVIQPLHARVKELTAQVQALRVEAAELQRRCAEAAEHQGANVQDTPAAEAAKAKQLESMFRHGRVEDAFLRAIQKQRQARHYDYLECLCALVPDPEAWLTEDSSGSPISAQAKMKLMHALALQLKEKVLDEPVFLRKVNWIQELWLAMDLEDKAVDRQAKGLCAQLIEALDSAQADGASKEQAPRQQTLERFSHSAIEMD
ncbi:unnamed protein product [Symbiodinium natans]|uniref:Uncharacterized protein n=1 Tax=Symbiodinium natans TaxID=878477 RepID=A0A812TLK2_9DINO|nr:unnamed protein product [Symbiodinium natans]